MMPQEILIKAKNWWRLLLASFVVCAFALAPAALLDWAARHDTTSTLRFTSESGTIWRGQGSVLVASTASPVVIPIRWRFDPLALLKLRVGFFIETSAPELDGTTHIGLRFGEIEFKNTAINGNARLLSMAHTSVALFAPSGKIRLQQADNEYLILRPASNEKDAWHVDGSMSAIAEQIALGGIVNATVGSHKLKILGDGASMSISITPVSGPLQLNGAGILSFVAPRRLTFSGFASTASDAPASLKQLGPLMSDGRQRVELNTSW
jgi:hypothetical protein